MKSKWHTSLDGLPTGLPCCCPGAPPCAKACCEALARSLKLATGVMLPLCCALPLRRCCTGPRQTSAHHASF